MDKALFYPYINLPETDWTMRTLLYYDNLGSIVPREYFYNPRRCYEPFMLKLVKAELVVPIDPMQALDRPHQVYRPLLDFIYKKRAHLRGETKFFEKSKIHFEKFNGVRVHRDKFSFDRVHFDKFRIHDQKFQEGIFYSLEQMGLAKRGDGNWFMVESRTANYMMKFLATVISSKLERRLTTNSIAQNAGVVRTRNRKREIILKELMPFPDEINITKLRKFKDKHGDLLKLFKSKVEQIVLEDKVNEKSRLFKTKVDELVYHRDEISARMNESRFKKLFFGTACGVAGAVPGLIATNTTMTTLGALPGFANAIYSAVQIEGAEKVFDQTGMKYIALVDKRLRNR